MAHERGAIEFNAPTGRAFWLASEIVALEKRAGGAGNQHVGDLDMRLTNLKPRMNHERGS